MRVPVGLLVASLIAIGCATAPAPDDPVVAVETGLRRPVVFVGDPTWTVEERMQHYGVPGMSLAVIDEGKVAWFKTYGLADRETGERATDDTLFQAGSVSKPVAAFGALRLVHEGLLSLDGDVNDDLTSWKLPPHEFSDSTVTLTRLLSHTGGTTVHGFPGYAPGEPVPTLVEVLDGKAPANTPAIFVDIEPGSQWRYSGGGYTIVQQMMIDVAGKPFPEILSEQVFEPLGMEHSTYENPLPPERLRHAAAGVLPDKSAVPGKRHTYPEMAAAGLWTTARDLAVFVIEVQDALRGEGRVLSQEMAEAMVEPVVDSFGRGFALSVRDGHRYFGHNGWDEGFCALLLASRDERYGVVVMINSNHPDFMDEVARAVAYTYDWGGYREYEPQPPSAEALERYPGRYRYNAEQAFTIVREGDRLFMQYVGSDPEELFAVEGGRYLRRDRTAPIEFTDEDGQIVFHFVLPDGGRQSHRRLADDEVQPREHLAAGRYEAALAAYRALAAQESGDGSGSEGYLNNQGLTLIDKGNFDQGIDVLRIATDLYPESANTWDSLGYAYREKGDRENAIRYYRKALDVAPQFPSAIEALEELEPGEAGG